MIQVSLGLRFDTRFLWALIMPIMEGQIFCLYAN